MLLPFSILNYDPGQADDLYDVCIQRVIPHISEWITKTSFVFFLTFSSLNYLFIYCSVFLRLL